ncbi:sensor histidine kinase [Streptomyces sp. NPDC098077]|uniref:sensor histidine kinase n=1 Tax=Streptomyces sp. NPDC098077 TaxID=3366093 RepID=UPI0038127563
MGTNTGSFAPARLRERTVGPVCAVLALLAVPAGLLSGPSAGWRAVLPMVVAVLGALAVASLHGRDRLVPAAAAVVAVGSALGTLFGAPPAREAATGVATLVEITALLLLVCLVARYAGSTRHAFVLCTVLGVLASTALLRLHLPPTAREAAAQSSFFALGAIAAAAAGGGLRALETRRIRAVHEARLSQRLQLAGDLHDFVAHDVSGIVVLAQAAQVIGAEQPEKIAPLLQQIEASGLQALGSLDRTVHMLRSSEETAPAGRGATDASPPVAYDLADIVDVVDRFRAAGRTDVRLDIGGLPEQLDRIPREVASTAHRVVVEALTNVRRHAGGAPWVTVSVTPDPDRPEPVLSVSVTNGPATVGEPGDGRLGDRGRHGASGLAGLATRTRALGGTLEFGVHGEHGWQVTAVLPLS